jgi:hypothetical protein
MKKIRAMLVSAVLLVACTLHISAQTPPAGNRYLFIVETAKAMKPQMPAVRQCMRDLLGAGLGGQLRAGDTLGFWTYDADLHVGAFPLQTWDPTASDAIIQSVDDFLNQLRLRNEAQIAPVLPPMLQVIKDSDSITVLIFSDGLQALQGTPFDAVINKIYGAHAAELRTAKIPFLTILQARGGKIVNCVINPANGPINIPKLAATPKPAPASGETNTAPAPLAAAPKPAKPNASLIVDYSKSNTVLAAARPRVTSLTLPARVEVAPGVVNTSAPESNVPTPVATTQRALIVIGGGSPTVHSSPSDSSATNILAESSARAAKFPAGALVAIGIAGLLGVVLVVRVFARRRAAGTASAITESFEQRRK